MKMPMEKPPEPWKMGKTNEGKPIFLPTRMRIKPNKYTSTKSPAPKYSPHCLNKGLKNERIIQCRSCMWQAQCGKTKN